MSVFDTVREKLMGAMSGAKPNDKELENTGDQPREDIELCSYVKGKVEEVRTQANRIAHEGIWMTNIAYLLGFDSVYYDSQTRQFRPATNSDSTSKYIKRNRIHTNLILPAVQNRLARLLKSPPKYDVRPNSMEEDDKESARLGIEVINDTWDRQQINKKRIDLGMWIQQCGHAYIGISYDDQLGDELKDPATGDVMGYEGDIRADIVSAFEGFCDPLAKTLEEAGWFARAKVRKLDYFKTHYDRGHLVKEEGAWLLSSQYEMRINTLNSTGPSSSGTSEQMKNAAIEISFYEKRSKKHPKGRHIVVANGVLLKNAPLPVGEIPYAKFDDVVVGGKYYSESLITHARPLQDQFNRALNKRAQWTNRLMAGKYIAAKGHGLIQEAFNDQSGEVIEYDPVPNAAPPSALQVPNIPAYAYEETKDLKQQLNEIFGLSEVSRGQLPSASIPAAGIQILLEQDETRIGIETEQHEHAWARVGMLILKYSDRFHISDRKLKTKGKNLQYQVKNYNGQMLRKNFDVTVIRGSTIPNSKVIKRQEIMNLYGGGLLGNPQDPATIDKVLSMLEYGDIGEAWQDFHLDMTQIQRDLTMIEMDEKPDVNKLDNHPLHIIVKNRYRKSEKYDALSDVGKALLEQNIEDHAEEAVKLMNPQLATPPPMPPPPMPVELRGADVPMPDGGEMPMPGGAAS